jgi:hypothetical protein
MQRRCTNCRGYIEFNDYKWWRYGSGTCRWWCVWGYYHGFSLMKLKRTSRPLRAHVKPVEFKPSNYGIQVQSDTATSTCSLVTVRESENVWCYTSRFRQRGCQEKDKPVEFKPSNHGIQVQSDTATSTCSLVTVREAENVWCYTSRFRQRGCQEKDDCNKAQKKAHPVLYLCLWVCGDKSILTANADRERKVIYQNNSWKELNAKSIHPSKGSTAQIGPWLPFWGFSITHNYTNGRTPLDKWSARRRGLYLHRTTQHKNTRDKHPCPERDSNPRSQQPSGRRPTSVKYFP